MSNLIDFPYPLDKVHAVFGSRSGARDEELANELLKLNLILRREQLLEVEHVLTELQLSVVLDVSLADLHIPCQFRVDFRVLNGL